MIRESNIEILRVVAMLMIVTIHVVGQGISSVMACEYGCVCAMINAFTVYGVIIFILISGYYSINNPLCKGLNLYIKCFTYGGLFYLIHLLYEGASLGRSIFFNTFLSISHSPGWWFIQVYFFLLLISPFLNSALSNLKFKELILVSFSFFIISSYFGWFFGNEVNKDGFNLINFIFVYCIGGLIRQAKEKKIVWINNRWLMFFVYIISSLILFLQWFGIQRGWYDLPLFVYNNPFVILGGVGLFLFFLTFSFKSKWINIIASTTLGIYMIHENCYISPFIYEWINENVTQFWQIFVATLIIFISCSILDYILTMIFMPLNKFATNSIKIITKSQQ